MAKQEKKGKHDGKNQKQTGNMVIKIISQAATDKLEKDMPGNRAS